MSQPTRTEAERAGWLAGYFAGLDAGQRGRPTDAEIIAWAVEIAGRCYRDGYDHGRASIEPEQRTAARVLTEAARIGADRSACRTYIPRRARHDEHRTEQPGGNHE